MKATTSKFKQIMASGLSRDYVIKVDLTLADDTVLHLTEEDVWNDSFSLETASSGNSSFDIGCAIIGQCKFSLNNFDERFNQYDFFNATAVVWIGLVGDIVNGTQQYYQMGYFTVDEPEYAGALIQLVCLDNMWKFDVPLPTLTVTSTSTAKSIIMQLCSHCGVLLDQTVNFHGYDFSITSLPEEEMNCRELLQYIAMIGCNFCYITPAGYLKLRWYDTSAIPSESDLDGGTFDTDTTPYSDGDNADGGNFLDYTSGDSYDGGTFTDNQNVAYFTRLFSSKFGTDVITITGVKFILNDTAYSIGQAGYVLELENPLVTVDNVNAVLNSIWDVLEGFSLRTFNITMVSDLSAEIGDCCAIKDYKGNYIYSWITTNTFKFAGHIVQCNAVNPTRELTKRYSKTVQAAVEVARKQADQVISNYDLAVQMMNSLAVNAMGGYEDYEDLSTGGRVWYLSNMPITKTAGVCSFETGSTVYKKSGNGFFVSRDGGTTWTNGYNMSTGELVVNVLDAIGVNAEWIKTGTLTVGGSTVGTQHPTIDVKDSSNNLICTINNQGITMHQGIISSPDYAETTGHLYADSGMKLDVLNAMLKSPYFTINRDGAFFNGTIEIKGDIVLGTGSFTFRPVDYYLATYFNMEFKAADEYVGSSTVVVELHYFEYDAVNNEWVEASNSPATWNYTLTDDEPELTTHWVNTVGANGHDYYQIKVTSSSTVTTTIKEAILAKIDQQGFHGLLQGIFKGRVESSAGVINGFNYGIGEQGFFEDEQGYEFNMRGKFYNPYGSLFDFWDGGVYIEGKEVSGGWLTNFGATLRLANPDNNDGNCGFVMSVPNSGNADLYRLNPGSGGAAGFDKALWETEFEISDTDITAGSTAQTGKRFYIVYE